jgi:diguanylate cyclase (GGDEF)-like protein
MSLRSRLYLVLGALFLVPILVGGLVLVLVVPQVQSNQRTASVRGAAVAMRAEIAAECNELVLASQLVANASAASNPQNAVRTVVPSVADYAALLGPSGTAVAQAGRLPPGVPGPASLPDCTAGAALGPVLASAVSISGVSGGAVTARVLDRALLTRLAARTGVDNEVVLLRDGRLVATSAPASDTRAVVRIARGRVGVVSADGWVAAVVTQGRGSPFTVVVASRDPGLSSALVAGFVLILAAGAAAAVLLVTSLARSLSQPFSDLTEVAERVAHGDFDARLDTVGEGEAGRLGEAFNHMTTELRRNMTALEQSREDLRDSLQRIGDTLMSTHDLEGLLQVVLETAVATLRAEAGVVLYGAPEQLRLVAEMGLHEAGIPAPTGVTVGAGVLGRVIATGESVRGGLSSGPPELNPASAEPRRGEILATPLRSMGAVTGVLALYGRQDGRPFDATDDDALRTLSGQASTAIDNVQLHQEAQRLSTTDALTGLWNFRYLSMSLAREIERSTRFERPLAVLMLDLDHFKAVNDTYGHARGDTVLRELAHRVQDQIREVDTYARYGGEEFVVVLPETTIEGAAQLAERICLAVRRQPFQGDGEEPLTVTVSIGVAAFPQHGSSAATLMRSADRALYVAKHEGRDRWHVAGEEATAPVGH